VAQPANQVMYLTPAQLAQTTFKAGLSGSDDILVNAFDGVAWAGTSAGNVPAEFQISVTYQRPVVTASNLTVTPGASLAASSLFSVTDPQGFAITEYAFEDLTGNGHFVVNGVAQPANQVMYLTAAQLAQTTFNAGLSGSDNILVNAFDGVAWAGTSAGNVPAEFQISVNYQRPVVTASNQTVAPGASVAAASLFSVTDPQGYAITEYAFEDLTGNGHFVVNGVAQPANQVMYLTPAQLAQTTFKAGLSGSDDILVNAFDGVAWAGTSAGNVPTEFQITVGGSGQTASSTDTSVGEIDRNIALLGGYISSTFAPSAVGNVQASPGGAENVFDKIATPTSLPHQTHA
jgi:hypothetical protein